MNNSSITNVLDSIVPISRLNKGEAGKVIEEVIQNGYRVIVKNNKPTCIMITPERYKEMMEEIEDFRLYLEAEKRESEDDGERISEEELMKELGITQEDIDNAEDLEIE